ncbi:hypothetical protein EJB05_42476, partial [Eragrostis curvula]
MVRLAAVAVAAALAALAAVAGATESYYALVENRLPSSGGMDLVCHAVGGNGILTDFSVVPRGHLPRGDAGRRVVELIAEEEDKSKAAKPKPKPAADEIDLAGGHVAFVRCNWAYAGNYLAGIMLMDTRWPEAKKCQEPGGAGGMCRVVFEGQEARLETPDGGVRVFGDLPVKRCRRSWLLFSSECAYPDHPHPYAGRRLGNAFQFFAV